MAHVIEMPPMEEKYQPFLHSRYHDGWCHGGARSQGISNHGIGLVYLEYSSSSNRKIKWSLSEQTLLASYDDFN